VGDVNPDEVVDLLATHLAGWSGPDAVGLPVRKPVVAPDRPRELVIEKKKAQVHIVLGFPGVTIGDPDQPALEVLTQVLSGQGGRLFLELRDRQSLAYAVTAFEMAGVDPGSFGVYIASAPGKLDASLAGLKQELARLLREPPTDEEILRAKGYLIGTQAVSMQPYSMQASLLSLDELYGLGAAWHLDYARRIEAITPGDLKRVAERLIRLDHPVVALVK
jgi:zinc protease